MKRNSLLLSLAFILGFQLVVLSQDPVLYWRFSNPIVIPGSPNVIQFDVDISCDQSGTYHSDLQCYFDYNTTAFGTNIAANNKITYERLEMTSGQIAGIDLYNIYGDVDNTPYTYAILTEAQFPIPNPTYMHEVPQYPTWAGYFRFTIEIADVNQLAGIQFAEDLMDGWQYYLDATHSTPTKYADPCIYDNDLLTQPLTPPGLTNLYITEITDPSTPGNSKYVEIYNGEVFPVNLDYFNVYLGRQANGGATSWSNVALTGILPAGDFYVVGYNANTTTWEASYGQPADLYSGTVSGNGDDSYWLSKNGIYYDNSGAGPGTLMDCYGVQNVDGTGAPWEYTNGHAVRNRPVNGPNAAFTITEWTITAWDNDDTQMTPWQHKATRLWQGTTSTNWNTKGNNWDGNGFVPDASDNVTIPDLTNDPTITLNSACHDLNIDGLSVVTQNSDTYMTVNGTLVNSTGTAGLVLKSDASNTASLIQTTSNVPATAERYLAEEQWHYVSSPITNGLSAIYEDIYLKSWDEPTAAWTYIVPLNIPLNIMEGYGTWSSNGLLGNVTVEHIGYLTVGAQSINTTYTAAAPDLNRGWNFVGNPYTSAIDWNAPGWTKTNIKDWMAMWNPISGNYGFLDQRVPPYAYTNGVDSIVPQTNGFFVDNVDGQATGTIGVTDAVRLHSSKAFFKGSDYVSEGLIVLSVHHNGYWDESVIRFADVATGSFDYYDTPKWDGIEEAPQLFSMDETGFRYSINTLPGIEENEIIPVGYSINTDGSYTLNVEGIDLLDETIPVYLEDLITGEFIDLRSNPSHTFVYSTDDPDHRFNLHFASPFGMGENGLANINIYSFNKDIYVNVPVISGEVTIISLMGQEILSETITSNLSRFTMEQSGYYIVKVVDGEQFTTQKVYIK